MQGILARAASSGAKQKLWSGSSHTGLNRWCNTAAAFISDATVPAAAPADQVRDVARFSVAEAIASNKPAAHWSDAAKLLPALSLIRNGLQHYGRCYYELSKARLSLLVVVTSGAGYVLGSGAAINLPCLGWTCLGTMLAAASANSFNQVLEVTYDSTMKRTMRRPLPAGRMSMEHAVAWAVASGTLGVSILAYETNNMVAALGAGNILLYTLAYTPLKQIHPVNTWVGAIVGAVPPLMGWAAAAGHLDAGAWVLASALYFWQLPHFMALSFMCNKDYMTGGYKMLSGKKAALVALRNCAYLLPIGFLAHYAGVTSGFFGPEALVMTAALGVTAAQFYQKPSSQSARYMFRAGLLYLPALMFAMLCHRIPNTSSEHNEDILVEDVVSSTTDSQILDEVYCSSEEKNIPAEKPKREECTRPPIAYASAAPFPFLPVPYFR